MVKRGISFPNSPWICWVLKDYREVHSSVLLYICHFCEFVVIDMESLFPESAGAFFFFFLCLFNLFGSSLIGSLTNNPQWLKCSFVYFIIRSFVLSSLNSKTPLLRSDNTQEEEEWWPAAFSKPTAAQSLSMPSTITVITTGYGFITHFPSHNAILYLNYDQLITKFY